MKIARIGADPLFHRGFELTRLGELLDDAVALELRDMVDEEDAVQVIDLVLDAGGKQPGAVKLLLLSIAIEEPHPALRWPFHLFVHLGYRQAALLVDRRLLGPPYDLGIDEHPRLVGLI